MSTVQSQLAPNDSPSAQNPHGKSLALNLLQGQVPSPAESRVRMIMAIGLVIVGAAALIARYFFPFDFVGDHVHGRLLGFVLSNAKKLIGDWSAIDMIVYPFALLAILLFERIWPAVPTQKTLSTGLIHDVLWVLIEAIVVVVLVRWYSRIIYRLYSGHLSFLTLSVARLLPPLMALGIGAVVLDLTRWVQHWLHHRVKWLWAFHAVHHAQRELNLFSDYRIHVLEYLVRVPVSLLPMLMLGLQSPQISWWLLITAWYGRLYHANIKSDFGWLRYILVTPQSHRVHHSRHPEHFEHNYGAILSVWDYLFGTQYRQYDIYPETGIADTEFPEESARSVIAVLTAPLRQMIYPFRWLRKV